MTLVDLSPVSDVVAALTVVAAILGYLPPIAAGFAIVWYSILIYDRLKKKPSGPEKAGDQGGR